MAGCGGLRHSNDLDEIPDAKFPLPQKMKDAQACPIRESAELQIGASVISLFAHSSLNSGASQDNRQRLSGTISGQAGLGVKLRCA